MTEPAEIPVGESNVTICAKTGEGLDELLHAIEHQLGKQLHHVTFLLPYSMAGQIETLHTQAKVLRCDYTGEGVEVETVCDDILYGRLRQYIKEE